MAYFLRQIGSDDGAAAIAGPFGNRAAAYEALKAQEAPSGTLEIAYVFSYDDRDTWTYREKSRFKDGLYQDVPWAAEDTEPLHYCHLSLKNPGMVAYTPDDESGFQDRQVRLRPGKYLEKYYAHVDLAIRQTWIAKAQYIPEVLTIVTTADEIETVFRNARKVESCMGPDGYSDFDVHPTRTYGRSDLACAFIGPIHNAIARAIVWPDRMIYNIMYPHRTGCGPAGSRLENLLIQAGYSRGSYRGAKIHAIPYSDGYLMPYVDGIHGADLSHDGKYFVLGHGPYNTQTQDGHVRYADPDGECNNCGYECPESELSDDLCSSCYDARRDCDHCGDTYFGDDDDTGYCSDCESNRQYCEICESDYFSGGEYAMSVGRHGTPCCDDCASTNEQSRFTCLHCGDTVKEWELSRDDQQSRIADGTALRFCPDCGPECTQCHVCAVAYVTQESPNACPDCGIAPRCPDTLDLLAGCRGIVDAAVLGSFVASRDHDAGMEVLAARLADDDAMPGPDDPRWIDSTQEAPASPAPYRCGCTVCVGLPVDDAPAPS